MSPIRQLPKLHLRGSLANITMANLNAEEKEKVNQITQYVAGHPSLISKKHRLLKQLRETIRGDYSNLDEAHNEYCIAIWRGVVELYYNYNYNFKCLACNSSEYTTLRHKSTPIDRIQTPCPNCKCVKITKPSNTQFVKDSYVNIEVVQKADYDDNFEYESTIVAIKHKKKYENPDDIINDPKQLVKFFGEFINNYYRQIINENLRQKTITQTTIVKPADELYVDKTIEVFQKLRIQHSNSGLIGDHYIISSNIMQSQPELSNELNLLKIDCERYNVDYNITDSGVSIKRNPVAELIAATITKYDYITTVSNQCINEDGDSTDNLDNILQTRANNMDLENHVDSIESIDYLNKIRQSIEDKDCRDIFDILTNQGRHIEFTNVGYDGDKPKLSHLAKFLNINVKIVKSHIDFIKLQVLAKRCKQLKST